MQQTCSNCRYPIQPGNTVCTNCGTPVSTAGGGSYDPTVRVGTPPGTGYGQQPPYGAPSTPDPYSAQFSGPPPANPYGAPPANPYGAAPANPYGAPPANPYGTPPANPFGTPPSAPGFDGPPPFGAPTAFPGQMPQAQKSRLMLYIGFAVVVVLLIAGGVGYALTHSKGSTSYSNNGQTGTSPNNGGQNATTGTHITKIQTGTGFDQNNNIVTGETSTFKGGGAAWVVFTIDTQDASATIQLKIINEGTQTGQSDPENITAGTVVDAYQLTLRNTGSDKVEIDYNGVAEASITFTVTS
jgi:hypothetical protein